MQYLYAYLGKDLIFNRISDIILLCILGFFEILREGYCSNEENGKKSKEDNKKEYLMRILHVAHGLIKCCSVSGNVGSFGQGLRLFDFIRERNKKNHRMRICWPMLQWNILTYG